MSEITRSPLCWPDNVARTAPQNRSYPQFNLPTVAGATSKVLHEINRLNGYSWDHDDDSVIISTNIRLRQDGLPRGDQAEPADTGVAVYFSLRFVRNGKYYNRPVVLSCDKWNKVGYNLSAIARDIEAQRARLRHGCTSVEAAFAGYVAIPEKCGGKSWWDLLGVPATAGKDVIIDHFRGLAKKHHPDVGGSTNEWNNLQNAYDQALASFR